MLLDDAEVRGVMDMAAVDEWGSGKATGQWQCATQKGANKTWKTLTADRERRGEEKSRECCEVARSRWTGEVVSSMDGHRLYNGY